MQSPIENLKKVIARIYLSEKITSMVLNFKTETFLISRHKCFNNCLRFVMGIALILSSSSVLAQLQPELMTNALDSLQTGAETNEWNQSQSENTREAGNQWRLYFAPEYFYWQENVNGRNVDDESGIRYVLGLSYKEPQEEGWLWAAQFKIYYGSVNYNGHTWGGNPIKSTTDYYGGLGELQYGYRWGINEQQNLDLMGGFEVEDWLRSGNGVGGYNENWLPISLNVGVEISPEDTGWIATLGVKVPVYTTEMIDLGRVGGGNVTLHPGTLPSAYAEAGYKFKNKISLVAFFDSYFFAESASTTANIAGNTYQVYQPQSQSYEAGLKLGWTF